VESRIAELHDKGIAAFNASRFEEAIQFFTQIVNEKSNDDSALGNRAIAYRQLGDYEKALIDINTAILLNPSQALHYSSKAGILSKLHRQLEAIEELDKAIALEPLVEYVVNKVVILKKLNRFKDALEAIENIESQNLESEELRLYKGIILFDTAKNKEALEIFESISDPNYKTIVDHYLSELKKTHN
jgi:tetratricopeptide (TPR) repeat protein